MATTGLARTMSKNKIRDARLESLKNAARDYEASPHLEDLERMVLGAARAWAKAERDVEELAATKGTRT